MKVEFDLNVNSILDKVLRWYTFPLYDIGRKSREIQRKRNCSDLINKMNILFSNLILYSNLYALDAILKQTVTYQDHFYGEERNEIQNRTKTDYII